MASQTPGPALQPTGTAGAQPAPAAAPATTKAKPVKSAGVRTGGVPTAALRAAVAVALVLQLLGIIVYLGGLSATQKRADDFNDIDSAVDNDFGIYWWTWVFELLLTLALIPLLISAQLLGRLRLLAVALLVYGLYLATNACATFHGLGYGSRSNAALAGAILMALANLAAIIGVSLAESSPAAAATGTANV